MLGLNSADDASGTHIISVTYSPCNTKILDRFQPKALCMTVDAPWYVPNTVIRRGLQTPTFKEEICHYTLSTVGAAVSPKRHSSEAYGVVQQQAIAKTPAKRSSYQICSVIHLKFSL
jgi:hypothetical protein